MSDAGPYSRTRAQSKVASRESTPSRSNQARRDGRGTLESTPATARRTGGRAANLLAPTAHDGDDELPPVRNKDSKAYGSAGKLTGPVQMDFTQTQRHPELALDTALAQAHARTTGLLPTLSEDPAETEPEAEHQPNTSHQEVSQDIEHSQQVGQSSAIGIERRTLAAVDNSAWAPRSGGSVLFGRLKNFFRDGANGVGECLFHLYDSAANWHPTRFLMWFACFFIIYTALQVTHGPLLWFDPPYVRSMRETWSSNDTMKTNAGISRIQGIEYRVSIMERTVRSLFSTKPMSESPPRINWFEIGQGAIIDPYYSSPSYVPKVDFTLMGFFTSLFTLRTHALRPIAYSQGPVEALMHWNDGGLDRWCAPSSRGKLQLTINVARPIAPAELIIEHIAKSATILVGMAPREVELWIDIEDEIAFYELERAISASDPSLLQNSSPEPNKELAPAQALPETFLPIARFYYDVHSNQAVQRFDVPFDLAAMKIKTSRIVIRANSNWGSYDATCINRVRLHAVDMSGADDEVLAAPLLGS